MPFFLTMPFFVVLIVVQPTLVVATLLAYLKRADREEEGKYVWGGVIVGLVLTAGFLLSFHDPRDHRWIFWDLFSSEWIAAVCLITISALRMHRQGWAIRNSAGPNASVAVTRADLWSFAVLSGLVVSGPTTFMLLFLIQIFAVPILLTVIAVGIAVSFGASRIKLETFLSVAAVVLLLIAAWLLWDVSGLVVEVQSTEQMERMRLPKLIPVALYLAAALLLVYRQRALGVRYARSHQVDKALAAIPFRGVSRQWLIVFLFILGGALLVGDVAFVRAYPPEGFTPLFILKALGVFAVSGALAGYVRYLFQRAPESGVSIGGLLRTMTIEMVAIGFVAGLVFFGPPSLRQLRKLDDQRLKDLEDVQDDVVRYWMDHDKLPVSLEFLRTFSPYVTITPPTDPITGQPYGYYPTGDLSFELCASFAVPRETKRGVNAQLIYGPESNGDWRHPAGPFCFTRVIDPAVARASER